MADGLQVLGVDAEATDDGMTIVGGPIGGGLIDSHGDHRIAMAFSIAALRARAEISINHCNNVATSFPSFIELARAIGLQLDVENM